MNDPTNGADDAVMSELFGLDHAHSPAAEELRERAAALELKVVTGKDHLPLLERTVWGTEMP